jgi:hypothetical protein
MKVLHFVLIAKHLTGDSKVVFFPSRLTAERFFQIKVTPLLEICYRNGLAEDEAYSFGQTQDIVRFDSGYDEELDALLGECNNYYYLGQIEVEVDVTHYVADFSEWVDESTIEFFTEEKAKEVWNDKVDNEIIVAAEHENIHINRYDQSTWEAKDGMTLFMETHYSDMYSDAYFGVSSDLTWTFRIGKIELGI